MKDYSKIIGIWKRDLPTCGTAPQPITSPRASTWIVLGTYLLHRVNNTVSINIVRKTIVITPWQNG